jgi:hypothetical protein
MSYILLAFEWLNAQFIHGDNHSIIEYDKVFMYSRSPLSVMFFQSNLIAVKLIRRKPCRLWIYYIVHRLSLFCVLVYLHNTSCLSGEVHFVFVLFIRLFVLPSVHHKSLYAQLLLHISSHSLSYEKSYILKTYYFFNEIFLVKGK